jgi:hypothetical protein
MQMNSLHTALTSEVSSKLTWKISHAHLNKNSQTVKSKTFGVTVVCRYLLKLHADSNMYQSVTCEG